jgi:putative ABC transport system substrate-binding protein
MKRRELIALLGGAAAAWPLAARAQRAYRLGILTGRGRREPNFVAIGMVEGQHLSVDQRGFEVREDQFPALAIEFVTSGVTSAN